MVRSISAVLVLLAGVGLIAAACGAPRPHTSRDSAGSVDSVGWEYKVVPVETGKETEHLGQKGKAPMTPEEVAAKAGDLLNRESTQGWELAGSFTTQFTNFPPNTFVALRRQKK